MTAQPQKRSTGRTILIIVLVLVVACVVCVGGAFVLTGGAILAVFNAAKPIVDVSDGFMNALKSSDFNAAYNLLAPDVQQEVGGSANALKDFIETQNVTPVSWAFTSVNINNDKANLSGSVTFTGNRSGTGSVVLGKSGDTWKIIGFELRPGG